MENSIQKSVLKLFNLQKVNQFAVGNTTYKQRIKKLNALKEALEVTYKDDIRKAMYDDFKKPTLETDLTEIYPVLSEINSLQVILSPG